MRTWTWRHGSSVIPMWRGGATPFSHSVSLSLALALSATFPASKELISPSLSRSYRRKASWRDGSETHGANTGIENRAEGPADI